MKVGNIAKWKRAKATVARWAKRTKSGLKQTDTDLGKKRMGKVSNTAEGKRAKSSVFLPRIEGVS